MEIEKKNFFTKSDIHFEIDERLKELNNDKEEILKFCNVQKYDDLLNLCDKDKYSIYISEYEETEYEIDFFEAIKNFIKKPKEKPKKERK